MRGTSEKITEDQELPHQAYAMPYALGPRSARPTGSTASSASGRLRRKVGMVEMIRQLADEIACQLAKDILSYDWLLKITQEQLADKSFDERTNCLVESLEILAKELGVNIGPAKLIGGKVHIQNWGDSIDMTIQRVQAYIHNHGDPGRNHEVAFGFWVGLPAA